MGTENWQFYHSEAVDLAEALHGSGVRFVYEPREGMSERDSISVLTEGTDKPVELTSFMEGISEYAEEGFFPLGDSRRVWAINKMSAVVAAHVVDTRKYESASV